MLYSLTNWTKMNCHSSHSHTTARYRISISCAASSTVNVLAGHNYIDYMGKSIKLRQFVTITLCYLIAPSIRLQPWFQMVRCVLHKPWFWLLCMSIRTAALVSDGSLRVTQTLVWLLCMSIRTTALVSDDCCVLQVHKTCREPTNVITQFFLRKLRCRSHLRDYGSYIFMPQHFANELSFCPCKCNFAFAASCTSRWWRAESLHYILWQEVGRIKDSVVIYWCTMCRALHIPCSAVLF
jgi:hypothetical protein